MIDFAQYMEPVARRLLGDPNPALSKPDQLRFGTHGSMAVEVAGEKSGTWFDHERDVGGGVLDLVRNKLGLSNGAAVEWMKSELGIRLDEQPEPARQRRIVAEYDYRDEDGELLYQVVRFVPKRFKQRRPNGKGVWDWSVNGVRQVPYRLNAILDRPESCPVYICEGEKDVDRLASLGLVATCNAGGAGKWRQDLSGYLRGATVFILSDNDNPGHQHAQQVAASLLGIAESVRVVGLPDLPPKGDVSNWLDAGGNAERLLELCQAIPPWSAEAEVEAAEDADLTFIAHDVDDLDQGEIPPREWLLANILCRRFVTLLAASGGCGKTSLLIVWALSLAIDRALTGDHVFKRSGVLILTFEDDLEECRRRLRAVRTHHRIAEVGRGWCHVVSLAGIGINLARSEKGGSLVETDAARRIIALIRRLDVDVVMFDPLVKLSDGDENDNRAADFLARILVRIAIEANVAVLVAHHFRKGVATAGDIDAARGARAIIDASRAALTLLPMSAEEAKRFEVSEEERRRLVRLDIGKANLALPAEKVRWYRLVSVPIDNPTDDYPHGDNVQTLERWEPPDVWESFSNNLLNDILDSLDAGMPDGERYSAAPSAKKRAAWPEVQKHAPDKTKVQCRQVIDTWVRTGVLKVEKYQSPERREEVDGLVVDASKRPTRPDEPFFIGRSPGGNGLPDHQKGLPKGSITGHAR